MSDEELEKLLSAVICAPTAFNLQHWRFVVVRDGELRRQIRAVAWDQPQVTDASVLIILTGDLKAWEKYPQRCWRNAPQPVQEFIVPAIREYYEGKEQVQRDEVMRSCGLAGMALMLAALEMGYESCPMDGFDFEAVGRLINLPEDHIISFMVAIGKATGEPWPRGGQLELAEVTIRNRFGA